MSTFGGIQQASTALNASQYGLSVVSQNIANASTPGYTRQVAQQESVDGVAGVPIISTGPGAPGGVRIARTDRMNDPVIDARARSEHARSATADTTASQLSAIEGVFPEPSDSGLSEQLNSFWNAFAQVANSPGSAAPRSVLLSAAGTVAGTLNAMSTTLSGISTNTAQALNQDLTSANTAAGRLATINGQIAVASATGANANPLLDQRDQLLDQLSKLIGGVATINANGSADVTVGGQSIVSANTATPLSTDSLFQVSVGANAVTVGGGSAAAEVTALTTTIPGYQAQLDTVANALSSAVNTVQAAGFDLTGAVGQAMFTGSGAAGITVALTDPASVAASLTSGGSLDGSNALAASELGAATGSPDSLYTTLVGSIGSGSALAQQQQATQDSVTAGVDQLRQSASGVNMDEEVSNMMIFQHAYGAASRVLTTMDSMLDTLINHTGLVGL